MSLVARLYLLVVLAVLPALAIQLHGEAEARRLRHAQVEAEALRYAELVADEVGRLVESARSLLVALAQAPSVQTASPACGGYVMALQRQFPSFPVLAILGPDGRPSCSNVGFDKAWAFADRANVGDALASGGFTVGRHSVNGEGVRVLPLALPITDGVGRSAGVVVTGLDLDRLHELLAKKSFPPGTAITVVDRDGTILVRLPNAGLEGSRMPERLSWLLRSWGSGAFAAAATETSDGLARVVGYTRLPETVGSLIVAVGLAEDWAFAGRREATMHALILLGLSALVACLAAWLGGRWFISRPIASLLAAAERWRGGDLSARVGLPSGGSELGELGAAFDSMAVELDQNLAALTTSEARYRALIEAIAAMVWTTRPDGTVEDMPDWRALTGQAPEQVRGLGWLEALHPDDRDRTREVWLQATAAGAPYDTEYRVRGPDGRYRWYNARGVPVRGADGAPHEYVGVCIDIDDRRRAEAELRLSQERLMLAEEVGRIGSWDWDLDTGRTTWSASLFRLLGLDPEAGEPSGEAFYARIHPDDRAKVTAEAEAAILGGRPLSTEFRILRPDGTVRWLATRGEALRDETGRPRRFVGVNFDVTEHHEAAERQRLLLRELSHRVKNCLATVQSIAALSLAGDRSLDEARETFTHRLRALAGTHNLLTASEWRGADLRALARGELKPFGQRATIGGEPLMLGAKAAQMLGLVLHELVTNAAKHGALSVPEGRVEVRWEVAAASPEHLRFFWRERQGPPVRPPARDGFGRKLVEQAVPYELKAQVRLDFAVEGLTYELEAPLEAVLAPG